MAYQPVREILDHVRQFHRKLRGQIQAAADTIDDPRTDALLKSIRQGEKEIDLALAEYEKQGDSAVLDTWIQYVPYEDLNDVLRDSKLPAHATPDEAVAWKQEFDKALAAFYRQMADQDAAPRVQAFFESLAATTEQRIVNESWELRDEDLAPDE